MVNKHECTWNITLVLEVCLVAIYYLVSEVKNKYGHIITANANDRDQKFELCLMALEKTLKPDNVKCALFLHIVEEKAIEVHNVLTFTEAKEGKYNALVCKFKKFVEGKKT